MSKVVVNLLQGLLVLVAVSAECLAGARTFAFRDFNQGGFRANSRTDLVVRLVQTFAKREVPGLGEHDLLLKMVANRSDLQGPSEEVAWTLPSKQDERSSEDVVTLEAWLAEQGQTELREHLSYKPVPRATGFLRITDPVEATRVEEEQRYDSSGTAEAARREAIAQGLILQR